MKIKSSFVAVIVRLEGLLSSCGPQSSTMTVPVAASARRESSLTNSLFAEVNAYRVSKGAGVLVRHPGLDRIAQQHCEFLRKNRGKFDLYGSNVSHVGFEGRMLAARQSYNINSLGENVICSRYCGADLSRQLVKNWAASKNHEYNMRSAWACSGIGVVVDNDGTVFATQIFGTPDHSQMAFMNRLNQF
jgi:uncharacterized protein YkwD